MNSMLSRCLPVLLLAPLAACAATPGDYPSLAIRDAERMSGTMQPPEPEPYIPPPPSAAVAGQLDQLAADAAGAHRRFEGEVAAARSAVSGAPVGSDAWARAGIALAALQAARSRTMIPLADLDRLYVDAASESGPIEAIAAVRDRVVAMVAEEDAVIRGLSGSGR